MTRAWNPARAPGAVPRAVLFDRDGTLVLDVPDNGDPDLVRPVRTAAAALALLRDRRIPVGVVTNQSGIAQGRISVADADAVDARVTELLGPFDTYRRCPHAPGDGCPCRKPEPGMILDAAAELGVRPDAVAVVGDIGADVAAAHAVGARAVLVPTPVTLPDEAMAAPVVCADLRSAVRYLLGDESGGIGGVA